MSHKGEEQMLGEREGAGIPLPSRPQPLLAPLDALTVPHLPCFILIFFQNILFLIYQHTIIIYFVHYFEAFHGLFLNNTTIRKGSKENNRKCLEITEEILLLATETAKCKSERLLKIGLSLSHFFLLFCLMLMIS